MDGDEIGLEENLSEERVAALEKQVAGLEEQLIAERRLRIKENEQGEVALSRAAIHTENVQARFVKEVDSLKEAYAGLMRESKTKKKNFVVNERVEHLTETLVERTEMVTSLEQALERTSRNLARGRSDEKLLVDRVRGLEEQNISLTKLVKKVSSIQRLAITSSKELVAAQEKNEQLADEVVVLKEQLATTKGEMGVVVVELSKAKDEVRAHEEEVTATKDVALGTENETTALTSERDSLRLKVQQLDEEVGSLKDEGMKTTKRVETIQFERDSAISEMHAVVENLKASQLDHGQVERENQVLQAKLEKAEALLSQKDTQLAKNEAEHNLALTQVERNQLQDEKSQLTLAGERDRALLGRTEALNELEIYRREHDSLHKVCSSVSSSPQISSSDPGENPGSDAIARSERLELCLVESVRRQEDLLQDAQESRDKCSSLQNECQKLKFRYGEMADKLFEKEEHVSVLEEKIEIYENKIEIYANKMFQTSNSHPAPVECKCRQVDEQNLRRCSRLRDENAFLQDRVRAQCRAVAEAQAKACANEVAVAKFLQQAQTTLGNIEKSADLEDSTYLEREAERQSKKHSLEVRLEELVERCAVAEDEVNRVRREEKRERSQPIIEGRPHSVRNASGDWHCDIPAETASVSETLEWNSLTKLLFDAFLQLERRNTEVHKKTKALEARCSQLETKKMALVSSLSAARADVEEFQERAFQSKEHAMGVEAELKEVRQALDTLRDGSDARSKALQDRCNHLELRKKALGDAFVVIKTITERFNKNEQTLASTANHGPIRSIDSARVEATGSFHVVQKFSITTAKGIEVGREKVAGGIEEVEEPARGRMPICRRRRPITRHVSQRQGFRLRCERNVIHSSVRSYLHRKRSVLANSGQGMTTGRTAPIFGQIHTLNRRSSNSESEQENASSRLHDRQGDTHSSNCGLNAAVNYMRENLPKQGVFTLREPESTFEQLETLARRCERFEIERDEALRRLQDRISWAKIANRQPKGEQNRGAYQKPQLRNPQNYSSGRCSAEKGLRTESLEKIWQEKINLATRRCARLEEENALLRYRYILLSDAKRIDCTESARKDQILAREMGDLRQRIQESEIDRERLQSQVKTVLENVHLQRNRYGGEIEELNENIFLLTEEKQQLFEQISAVEWQLASQCESLKNLEERENEGVESISQMKATEEELRLKIENDENELTQLQGLIAVLTEEKQDLFDWVSSTEWQMNSQTEIYEKVIYDLSLTNESLQIDKREFLKEEIAVKGLLRLTSEEREGGVKKIGQSNSEVGHDNVDAFDTLETSGVEKSRADALLEEVSKTLNLLKTENVVLSEKALETEKRTHLQIEQITANEQDLKRTTERLEVENRELESRLLSTQELVKSGTESHSEVIGQMKNHIGDLERERIDLTSRLAATEGLLKSQTDSLQNSVETVKQTRQTIDDLKVDKSELRGHLSRIEAETSAKVAQLQTSLTEKEKTNEILTKEKSQLSDRLAATDEQEKIRSKNEEMERKKWMEVVEGLEASKNDLSRRMQIAEEKMIIKEEERKEKEREHLKFIEALESSNKTLSERLLDEETRRKLQNETFSNQEEELKRAIKNMEVDNRGLAEKLLNSEKFVEAQIEGSTQTCEKMKDDVEKLEHNRKDLLSKLTEKEELLKSQAESHQKNVAKLDGTIADLKADRDKLSKEIYREKMQETAARESQKEEIDEMSACIATVRSENETLAEQVAAKQSQIESATKLSEAKVLELENRLKISENGRKTIDGQLKEAHERLKSQDEDRDEDSQRLETIVLNLEKENSSLKEKMNGALKEAEVKRESDEVKKKELLETIRTLKVDNKDTADRLLAKENQEKLAMEQHTKALEKMTSTIDGLEHQRDHLLEELASAEDATLKQGELDKEHGNEMRQMVTNLAKEKEHLAKLLDEETVSRNQKEVEAQEAKETLQSMLSEKSNSIRTHEELTTEKTQLRAEVDALNRAIVLADDEKERVQAQLATSLQEKGQFRSELDAIGRTLMWMQMAHLGEEMEEIGVSFDDSPSPVLVLQLISSKIEKVNEECKDLSDRLKGARSVAEIPMHEGADVVVFGGSATGQKGFSPNEAMSPITATNKEVNRLPDAARHPFSEADGSTRHDTEKRQVKSGKAKGQNKEDWGFYTYI